MEATVFCPRCSTENSFEQRYCRQCGLSLPAVNLALAGCIDEALSKLKKGSSYFSGGVVVLIIGLLNALVNGYFAAWQSAVFSAALGSVIGVPLIAAGIARVRSAKRLLNPEESEEGLKGLAKAGEESSKALHPKQPISVLVTEGTTMKLDSAKSESRQKAE
jgi:hypothetical protein